MDLKSDNDSLLISYLSLRKAVGIIGIALPFVLALGNWQLFHANGIEDSISYYYYTSMRGVLVGSLWAIGIFLMSYRGYQKRERNCGPSRLRLRPGRRPLPARGNPALAMLCISSV